MKQVATPRITTNMDANIIMALDKDNPNGNSKSSLVVVTGVYLTLIEKPLPA